MGALGVRFDPENQVSRTGHVDFPILGDVSSRVVESDFLEVAMRRECSGQLKNSRLCPTCMNGYEFTLDFTENAAQISPAFVPQIEAANKHNIVQNNVKSVIYCTDAPPSRDIPQYFTKP